MKKATWLLSRLFFLIILSTFYAIGSKINPIPALNTILWFTLIYCVISSVKEIGNSSKTQAPFIIGIAIILCYVITAIQNAHYIASYNELYLTGINSVFPETWLEDSLTSILHPSVWYQKLKFTMGFEHLVIHLGSHYKIDFGVLGTNLIRFAEYLGFFITPFLYRYVSVIQLYKSKKTD